MSVEVYKSVKRTHGEESLKICKQVRQIVPRIAQENMLKPGQFWLNWTNLFELAASVPYPVVMLLSLMYPSFHMVDFPLLGQFNGVHKLRGTIFPLLTKS